LSHCTSPLSVSVRVKLLFLHLSFCFILITFCIWC
jgi:hypothetical protein